MITAKEALEQYDELHQQVTKMLALIDIEIRKVAPIQKYYVCNISDLTDGVPESWSGYKMNTLQSRVAIKLREFGYTTILETFGKSYVPRGLSDDDGNGPQHVNLVLKIWWADQTVL